MSSNINRTGEEDAHFQCLGNLLVFGELRPIIRGHSMQFFSYWLKCCDGCFRQRPGLF